MTRSKDDGDCCWGLSVDSGDIEGDSLTADAVDDSGAAEKLAKVNKV